MANHGNAVANSKLEEHRLCSRFTCTTCSCSNTWINDI